MHPVPFSTGYYTLPEVANPLAQHQTGQAVCPIGSYCIHGSAHVCPPGVFGAATGLSSPSCNGSCAAGYYCPANSTIAAAAPCGDVSVYCPAGSGVPVTAPDGVYTVGPDEATRNDTQVCPSGSYCVGGVLRPCPGGRFGCAPRLSTLECNGACTAGYYCPEGSTTNQAAPCGVNASYPLAPTVYCPPGSAAALPVTVGYYSIGAAPHLAVNQSVCPLGTYCVGGIMVRLCCARAHDSGAVAHDAARLLARCPYLFVVCKSPKQSLTGGRAFCDFLLLCLLWPCCLSALSPLLFA